MSKNAMSKNAKKRRNKKVKCKGAKMKSVLKICDLKTSVIDNIKYFPSSKSGFLFFGKGGDEVAQGLPQ